MTGKSTSTSRELAVKAVLWIDEFIMRQNINTSITEVPKGVF
jgi:hypothetical protein